MRAPAGKRPRFGWTEVAACVLVLACLAALQWHNRRAHSEELAWLLVPTARLVEAVTGIAFVREAGTGFVSPERRVLIVPACAGVRFLAVSFSLCVFLGFLWLRSARARWGWLPAAAAAAWTLTVLTNALRIALSIHLYEMDIYAGGWFTPARVHRVAGVATYLASLGLFAAAVSWILARLSGNGPAGASPGSPGRDRRSRLLPAAAVAAPVLFYCAVVLVHPLLGGAARDREAAFVEHGGTVLGLCLLWLVLRAGAGRLLRRFRARRTA
jgi:exosortase K